eukprot:1538069-Prymnesium_polylepis.1
MAPSFGPSSFSSFIAKMTYGSRDAPLMSVCARSCSSESSLASQSRTSSLPAYTSRAKPSDMKATSQPSAPRSHRASCSAGSLYASKAKPAASTAVVTLNGAGAAVSCSLMRGGAVKAAWREAGEEASER